MVFGLTRLLVEPTIYPTQEEHSNHYTTAAVQNTNQNKIYTTNKMNAKECILNKFSNFYILFVLSSSYLIMCVTGMKKRYFQKK